MLPELLGRRGVSISIARRDKKREVEKEEALVLVGLGLELGSGRLEDYRARLTLNHALD